MDQHSDEAQQIRQCFARVWEDADRGDPASAIAFLAPDGVHYDASNGGPEL
ncbi:MAG: hypothetical protein AB1505_12615 [Candidatus Latescibacterota bacterium]